MGKVKYAVIGSGWRAEFYIRIAKAVPEKFDLTAVLIRNEEKGRKFSEKFGVTVVNTVDTLMKDAPEFVVLAIKRGCVTDYLLELFEKGIPVALNGEKMDGVALIEKLNEIGGANGIGIIDMVENRLVGMKSRGVYETPGGTILYKAHADLEEITLDKYTQHFKQKVSLELADILYNGYWYSPLTEAINAFVDKTQENVNGDVKLKLYKGNIMEAGMTSPTTLYSEQTASFGEDDDYNQADSAGFINLYGLPIKMIAKAKEHKL